MAIMGVAAYLSSWFFVFPSIGPSAFLMFYAPSSAMSAPRNTVLGHLMGLVIGIVSYNLLKMLGLVGDQILLIVFAGFFTGTFGLLMVLTDILHPPAASSCLIAALGLIKNPIQAVAMVVSVVLLCLQGYLMNNLVGIKYPLWNPMEDMPLPKIRTVLGDISETKSKDPIEELAAKLAMRQRIDDK